MSKELMDLGLNSIRELRKIHLAHKNMIDRCYNEKNQSYRNYGGRGIDVCEEWLYSRDSFVRWSLSNGHDVNKSIDRIDNDKGYFPNNCRWVEPSIQASNQRRYEKIMLDGVEMTIYDASIKAGAKSKSDFTRFSKRLRNYNVTTMSELVCEHLLSHRVNVRDNKCLTCGRDESCKWRDNGTKCNTCYCKEHRNKIKR